MLASRLPSSLVWLSRRFSIAPTKGCTVKHRSLGAVAQTAAAVAMPSEAPAAELATGRQSYVDQLADKTAVVKARFADLSIPEIEVFSSAEQHYRMRCEFRVWQEDDDLYYVMFDKTEEAEEKYSDDRKRKSSGGRPVRCDEFPVASAMINRLMPSLMEHVKQEPALQRKLFQANFHTTLSGEAMITLIYHKKLDDAWREAAEKLRTLLTAAAAATAPVSIIGRSRGQKHICGEDYVTERLKVDGRELSYRQVEASFSQPNGEMCLHMLEWARRVTHGSSGGDLLELYCGNGNFTIALASNFREVVATEVSKVGIAAAQHNAEANGATNVHLARLSAEEFVQAWRGERTFARLNGLDLKRFEFSTILVDPPRAGLDDQTVQLLQHFDRIVYVSCNPATLHANLQHVAATHSICNFAIFDQFPWTAHTECGVYLRRHES